MLLMKRKKWYLFVRRQLKDFLTVEEKIAWVAFLKKSSKLLLNIVEKIVFENCFRTIPESGSSAGEWSHEIVNIIGEIILAWTRVGLAFN